MKKSKSKKFIITIVLAFLIVSIPMFIRTLNYLQLTKNSLRYVEPFVEQAIEYVRSETDAIQRYAYGEKLELICSKRVAGYYEGRYAKFSTSEEFQTALKYLEIHVDVNGRATCVVVFEGTHQGQIEITKYYWK